MIWTISEEMVVSFRFAIVSVVTTPLISSSPKPLGIVLTQFCYALIIPSFYFLVTNYPKL